MAIAWIGSDKLVPLLDGGTTIVVSNEAEPQVGVTIVGFACASHGAGGVDVRRSTDVALEAGDSIALVDERVSPVRPTAVETTLRLLSAFSRDITEVYARSDEARTEPIDSIEIGVIATDKAPADAVPVPEVEGLSAYIKLEP